MEIIDVLYGFAAPQAKAFATLIAKKKKPRKKKKAKRFKMLKKTAKQAAVMANRGHYARAFGLLMLAEGLALGLDLVTEKEMAKVIAARV